MSKLNQACVGAVVVADLTDICNFL
jgi:hypothetical protein